MQQVPLQIADLLRHGLTVFGDRQVLSYDGRDIGGQPFRAVGEQAARLAHGLRSLGVDSDQRVGTLLWNTPDHLAAYFGVPAMGAVLHTLNMRLSAEQLGYVIDHADDEIVVVDSSLVDVLAPILPQLPKLHHVIVVGDAEFSTPRWMTLHRYDEVLADQAAEFDWPTVDEQDAASICYTTGTTGRPKGVAYSHRSTVLHSMSVLSGNAFGLTDHDRVMPMVPMFHANAWGWPYAAWIAGADIVLTNRYLSGSHLLGLIERTRPTAVIGVPTIWRDLVDHATSHGGDLSSIRLAGTGGTALPQVLADQLRDRFGLHIIQGWGMTETSPLVTWAAPPRGTSDPLAWQMSSGRLLPEIQIRLVGDGDVILPDDGTSMGEIELRGPWISGSYIGGEGADRFHEGWLRTGDLGTISHGWVKVLDRAKDGIKSGGEWIPTLTLESELSIHPDVAEVSVIGVPDARWDERPLACVILEAGATATVDDLRAHLARRVPRWWLPERWSFVASLPHTSVGKQDKKALLGLYDKGELEIRLTHETARQD